MADCKTFRSFFVEALYGELDEDRQKRFEAHLCECSACREAYRAFSDTLVTMDTRSIEEPPRVYFRTFWKRLAPRIAEHRPEPSDRRHDPEADRLKRWSAQILPRPAWIGRLAGAAAFLVIGILIGRLFLAPGGNGRTDGRRFAGSGPSKTEFASLEDRTQRYIQKSKVLLLGIINFDPETEDVNTLNLDRQQQISENLVREAGTLKAELTKPAQQRLRRLVTDLELILVQIANLETEHDLSAIELVRSGVDRNGLLMKINLAEMMQAESEPEDIPASEETTTI